MSAFICNDYHLSYIVNYARRKEVFIHLEGKGRLNMGDEGTGKLLFDILRAENWKSVNARYKQNDPVIKGTLKRLSAFADFTLAQIIKACNCFEYQTSETAGWENSDAYKIIQYIKDDAMRTMPGYEAAEWELSESRGA